MATFAFAQTKSTVIGTVHDINSGGCKSCHAPHNGSVATGGTDQNTGKILLWDRGFTNVTFGTYSSPTMNSVAAEVGTTTPAATDPRLYSFLCLSCHDGVTSPTLIGPTNTKAIGNVTKSAGLTNDHPINMAHDPTLDTGLKTVAQVTGAGLFLYGTSNTVQCASCHNVHNNTNSPFLRKANTNSALCTSCHL
jgi:predicted CXXCH cytochrome family protein